MSKETKAQDHLQFRNRMRVLEAWEYLLREIDANRLVLHDGTLDTLDEHIRCSLLSSIPTEPTDDMAVVGGCVLHRLNSSTKGICKPFRPYDVCNGAREIYRAMLAAAPKASQNIMEER